MIKVKNHGGFKAVLLLLLLSFSLILTACDGSGSTGTGGENDTVTVKIENGFMSTGKRTAEFKNGASYTVIAEERVGMYFDGWLKNGKKTDLEETFVATVDLSDGDITYEATYLMSPGATFEDTESGEIFGSVSSGMFNLDVDLGSSKIEAEIMTEPFDPRNTVLKFTDDDEKASGSVKIDIASVPGDFLVYSVDFYVDSFSGNIPLSIRFGNYNIDFYAPDSKFKICDSNGGSTASLKSDFSPYDWHNIKVAVSNDIVNGRYAHSYVYLDGHCVAESYNVNNGTFASMIYFSANEQSKVVAYIDNIIAYRQSLTLAEETAMNPDIVVKETNAADDAYYMAELFLSEGAVEALKEMDSHLFSENIYRWIAELYDPETSAIYFSISGRDNYGYLPDIETVAQAYGILSTLGLGGASSVLNDEQKANLLAWIQTLQSNRDGYYYHPHWGVSINNSRLSRDLGNSGSSYSASGGRAYRLFNDANYRLSNGSSGNKGVTVPSTYDNTLTGRLVYSDVSLASKVVLAAANSSMPHHLRSEENLVTYINKMWNETCRVSGVHERHFCTEDCVKVEDSSDSYMEIIDGKLVITRGYRCTSCHECKHTTGHSYSFGHRVTSMGSQIKAVGFGTPTVMYFYDIQENVQASLRDKAQAAFIEEHGESAWDRLSQDEQTEIREAAENGIWEEEITYNTISGLLKICGIPGTHGYEFLYAAEAIDSAIKGALFSVEDYVSRREAIVSIYNPFNAINGIMGNINKYGSDPEIRTEAIAVVRSQAEALIRNTSEKLKCYLMPDGGYSYSMSGYCTHSQSQPVAINGWNNGVGEGDVNGTALALGTRSALISCLGISIGSPFGGTRALYSEEGYDLDCNGVIEGYELTATHSQVFRSLITNKAEIEKVDVNSVVYNYDFEGEYPLLPSSGAVISDGNNKVVEVIDNLNGSGLYTSFLGGSVLGNESKTNIRLDMKVIESNNTVSHQLFAGSSNSLQINFTYKDGYFTFTNVAATNHSIVDKNTGKEIKVNAKEWFTLEIDVYISGATVDGQFCYGVFKVTQNDLTQTGYINSLKKYSDISGFQMYSLNSAVNKVYYDNVKCSAVIKPGVYDGEYHFDSVNQKISDNLTASPTNPKDTVYGIACGMTASFTPDKYSTSSVIYNFDSFQCSVNLSNAKVGDKVFFAFKDSEGKKITGVYLEINEDGTISFYTANGQLIRFYSTTEDTVLSADVSKWLLVKLEYHYDMAEPQFDVVVKYADLNNNSYNKTVASSFTNVLTYDAAASPDDFSVFDVHYESDEGTVYVDDLYLRNVLVP